MSDPLSVAGPKGRGRGRTFRLLGFSWGVTSVFTRNRSPAGDPLTFWDVEIHEIPMASLLCEAGSSGSRVQRVKAKRVQSVRNYAVLVENAER